MREEVKTRLSGAAAALVTSVVLALYQSGRLWSGLFTYQVLATVIAISWAPYLNFSGLISRVPSLLMLPLFLSWFCLACSPVLYYVILDLFTGHRVEGSQWYDAVWRVYVIMILWIAIAVCNERIIRPWWRANSDRFMGPLRSNSVAAQAHQITLDKRTEALEAIKRRVVVVLKKKKLAERSIAVKKREIERAKDNVGKLEQMVTKAHEKAEGADGEDKEAALDEAETMEEMVESARIQGESLKDDMKSAELDLVEFDAQLKLLQSEWTEALHIQNHTSFYR